MTREPVHHEHAVSSITALLPTSLPTSHRFVIAIAGPPASGKSTLAAELIAALAPDAAAFGLDAYHFDNQILQARNDLTRKGAPHTFDVAGYAHMLDRLRSLPDQQVAIPQFDRAADLSRDAASLVNPNQNIVVTEGNYLLLDQEPWTALASLFDLTVWLDVPLATVEQRIIERWQHHGLDAAAANDRLIGNDLPNARLVKTTSRPADLSISQPDSSRC